MEDNLDEFDYMIINVEYLLNGSLENLNNFTDILSNDNLNDIKFFNVGKYRCPYNSVAETLVNSPFNTAFTMETLLPTGLPGYNAQKAIEFVSGHCKWRKRDMDTGFYKIGYNFISPIFHYDGKSLIVCLNLNLSPS